jgi:hypothetical protein
MDPLKHSLRTFLVAVCAILIVSTVPAVLAPAAQAATSSPSPGCLALNSGGKDGYYSAGYARVSGGFIFAAGEKLRITAAAPSFGSITGFNLDVRLDSSTVIRVSSDGFPATITYTLHQNLEDPASYIYYSLDPFSGTSATWSFSCIPVPTSPAPADQHQQVAAVAGRPCSDVDESSLDWAQGIIGGWSASWAEWPHNGSGGPVCTRTISYSSGEWHAR